MEISVGKKYRTRGGECVEISGKLEGSQEYPFISNRYIYTPKGLAFPNDLNHPDNLISEWEEPAQFVTGLSIAEPDVGIPATGTFEDDPVHYLPSLVEIMESMDKAEQYWALSYLNSRYRGE